jgi:hypothetical protein
MRNSKVLAAIFVNLSFLLAGCQTTLGLSVPSTNKPPPFHKDMYFSVHDQNDSSGWARILSEFVPEDHASAKFTDNPNAHFVFLRVRYTESFLKNLPLIPGGLTLFIIPGCGHTSYTADFEVYLAQNRARNPTKLHYEFSAIRCIWLPTAFAKNKPDPSDPIRELYRQFFSDYAKLLSDSKVSGDKHE